MTALLPSPTTIAALVKIGLLVGGLMTAAAYLVLLERWIAAKIASDAARMSSGAAL